MTQLIIQAFNEPEGEGNGWHMCTDTTIGARFYVCEEPEGESVAAGWEPIIISNAFPTRASAEIGMLSQ